MRRTNAPSGLRSSRSVTSYNSVHCPYCCARLRLRLPARRPRRLRVSFVRVESGVAPLALRDARIRMGLTQHELARLIDVAGGERISRWELGSSALRPEMLHRLAQALNVDATAPSYDPTSTANSGAGHEAASL